MFGSSYTFRLPRLFLSRPRLLSLIDDVLSQKLLVVNTPSGWGATSLVLDWCLDRSRSEAVIPLWLSADMRTDHASSFEDLLFEITENALLAGCDEGRQQSVGLTDMRSLHGRSEKDYIQLLRSIASVKNDVVFVVDGYDRFEDSETRGFMEGILADIPVQVHFLLISKTMPRLNITLRQATGQCSVISRSELAFNEKEILQYMKIRTGQGVTKHEVKEIAKLTEGWLLALRLLSLELNEGQKVSTALEEISGGSCARVAGFVSEAMDELSEADAIFVLQASLLERFTPGMCDSVLMRRDSLERIESLEGSFFITRDDESHVFVNAIFRIYLQKKAITSDLVGYDRILMRIYDWYVDNRRYENAVCLAAKFHYWDALGKTVELQGRVFLQSIVQSVFCDIDLGLESVPCDSFEDNPTLLVLKAIVMFCKNDFSEMEKLSRSASRLVGDETPPSGEGNHALKQWAGILTIIAVTQQGRIHESLDLLDEVSKLHLSDDCIVHSWLLHAMGGVYGCAGLTGRAIEAYQNSIVLASSSENVFVELMSSYFLANLLIDVGKLQRAEEVLLQAKKRIESEGAFVFAFSGLPEIGLARLSLKRCEAKKADELLYLGVHKLRKGSGVVVFIESQITYADMKLLEGDLEGARIVLEKVAKHAFEHHSEYYCEIARCLVARLQLLTGDDALAQRWVEDNAVLSQAEDIVLRTTYLMTSVKVSMASGSYHEAERTARYLADELRGARRVDALIRACVSLAVIHFHQGRMPDAAEVIAEAIELASPGGIIQPFFEEKERLAPVFKVFFSSEEAGNLLAKGVSASFLADLSKRCGFSLHSVTEAKMSAEIAVGRQALTKREREVCHLLIQGLGNKEVAERLYISINTVHAHCCSIYSKLGIHNRQELESVFSDVL